MHNKMFQMVILVYLVSVFCIPSTLGIYKNTSTASEILNLADWDVALNQNGISGNVSAQAGGSDGSYLLKVVSNSEVDVIYSITVSNIPSGVTVKIDNGTYKPYASSVIFDDVGTINYSDQNHEKTHTLYFKASSGATLVNNQTVNIDVDFKQN